MADKKPVEKQDWQKIVGENSEFMFFLPEELKVEAKTWHEAKLAFDKKIADLSKDEILLGNLLQNLFIKVRTYFENAGRKDVWAKDIGFEVNALKDGEYIINLYEASKRG